MRNEAAISRERGRPAGRIAIRVVRAVVVVVPHVDNRDRAVQLCLTPGAMHLVKGPAEFSLVIPRDVLVMQVAHVQKHERIGVPDGVEHRAVRAGRRARGKGQAEGKWPRARRRESALQRAAGRLNRVGMRRCRRQA